MILWQAPPPASHAAYDIQRTGTEVIVARIVCGCIRGEKFVFWHVRG